MHNRALEIISFNIKTNNSDFDDVYNKCRAWLQKISAEIEEITPTRISAVHKKLYPSFQSKLYLNHVDPSYWKKRILLNYIRENNVIIINIKMFYLDRDISKTKNLDKWWFFWVYDLLRYLNVDVDASFPSYTENDIDQMRKEVINHSKYKILFVLVEFLMGIWFLVDFPVLHIRVILGLLFIISAIVMGYELLKMYSNVIEKLNKLSIARVTQYPKK